MATKKYLIISAASWALLSPAEQGSYEDHFPDLCAQSADTDFTGTVPAGTPYETEAYEAFAEAGNAKFEYDANNNAMTWDMKDYLITDSYTASLIIHGVLNCPAWTFKNMKVKSNIAKGGTTDSLFYINRNTPFTGNWFLDRIDVNANGNQYNIVNIRDTDSNGTITNLRGYNGNSGNYGGIYIYPGLATGDYTFDGCTVKDAVRAYRFATGPNSITINNCYGQSTTTVITGVEGTDYSDPNGTCVTSDATAKNAANRNLAPSAAFQSLVDTDDTFLLPKEGTVMENFGADSRASTYNHTPVNAIGAMGFPVSDAGGYAKTHLSLSLSI